MVDGDYTERKRVLQSGETVIDKIVKSTTGSNMLLGKKLVKVEEFITKYRLNLIYLLDTSGSMNGEPINQLNAAMAEAVQAAEEVAKEMEVQLVMRVVEFNSSAHWLIGDTRNGVGHIDWVPLKAQGGTDTAGAIDLARSVMNREFLGERSFHPIVILISDGQSNDPQKMVEAVENLKASFRRATNRDRILRIAIGVTGANLTELNNFASVGFIKKRDGTVIENQPLVFNVDYVDLLKEYLKGVIWEAEEDDEPWEDEPWEEENEDTTPVIRSYNPDTVDEAEDSDEDWMPIITMKRGEKKWLL